MSGIVGSVENLSSPQPTGHARNPIKKFEKGRKKRHVGDVDWWKEERGRREGPFTKSREMEKLWLKHHYTGG